LRILLPRALQNGPKPLFAERLQQIVKRVHFKRPQSVLIMRSYKYNAWHLFRRDCLYNSKPIHPRHLHIQENQVGAVFLNGGNRRFRPTRFSNHVNIRLLPQKPQYLAPRRRFVVDNQYLECAQGGHSSN
jgi:hypothetical protein